ncbi:Histidinol-phosphatase [Labrenzia sp. THAF82]|uniref:inositol monophosphatase family protein n=1 Tax=Labrenzia sp. THAF82 TaxID=2587861 RepID=UPI0012A9F3FE|nr:inositol monophosphatase family protein [Labrenzia sp. THAF82]QFT30632.1 Histidinol-phosphatase [Labrenzia sp. THAF82]
MPDLSNRLEKALAMTEEAAAVSLLYFRKNPETETKADLSPVTQADKATERSLRDSIQLHFPDEAIFGEEFGQTGEAAAMWIIDPIDGTRSFIAGLPLFGMLLGFLIEGCPKMGVIRMPALGEVYAGGKNLQATCNGTAIHVSSCRSLADARLFINEGDKLALSEPEAFQRLVRSGQLRRLGADCYPHALLARGHVDAVVDYDLQPYDYLPVSAVVEAAGGVMTDWQGNPLTMTSDGRTVTAATPNLHAELLEVLNRP